MSDGIAYWNEDMPPFEANNQHDALDPNNELIEDYNLIGWSQDINGNGELDFTEELMTYRSIGVSTMPNIIVGNDNQLFVILSSTTETYEIGDYNYKHVWIRRSPDGGPTWGNFYDLTSDLSHLIHECIYPVIAGSADDNVHLFYNADETPGMALDEEHPYQENKIIYVKWPVVSFTSIEDPSGVIASESVSQNFPNPFSQTSEVWVELRAKTSLKMEIYDIMGQKVYEIDMGQVNAGKHKFVIDANVLSSGIYFYTVETGRHSVTKKMIIE